MAKPEQIKQAISELAKHELAKAQAGSSKAPLWEIAGPGSLFRKGKLLGPGELVEMSEAEAKGLPKGLLKRV